MGEPRQVFVCIGTDDPLWGPAAEEPSVPGLITPDRLQHVSLSFSSGLALGLVTEEPAAAAGGALLLGVAKELFDPHFDRGDLAADLVGATLAALLTHALTR